MGSKVATDGRVEEQFERPMKLENDELADVWGGLATAATLEGVNMLANTVLVLLPLLLEQVLMVVELVVKPVGAACVGGESPITFSGNSG